MKKTNPLNSTLKDQITEITKQEVDFFHPRLCSCAPDWSCAGELGDSSVFNRELGRSHASPNMQAAQKMQEDEWD